MEIGVFARTFPRPTLEAVLDAVAASGAEATQFNMALTGAGLSLPEEIPAATAARVREAAARRRVRIAALSGTYNMAHPDAGVREDGHRRLAVLIASARAMGTSVVTLCSGTRDPEDQWRAHPGNRGADAWEDMLASVARAVAVAEAHGVTLAVEPEHANVVDSAQAARRLLDTVASPHLGVVLDAANLLRRDDQHDQRPVLEGALELLAEDVVLAHAKELGWLDYPLFLRLLAAAGYDRAVVLHGGAEDEVPGSVAALRAAMPPVNPRR